jgi:hypothetical protein
MLSGKILPNNIFAKQYFCQTIFLPNNIFAKQYFSAPEFPKK